MAAVPQKTLNWLWDVLRREYRDPQRAYTDLAQSIALFPGLAPRTDVYTSENGAPALLLHLNGTLPVHFRGNQYRFPIAIWVPHAYPYEPPILYVTPTDDIVIRPGQHVSGSDGKIYHPYLARWREAWDRSTIAEFLKLLVDVFTREPPVMSKQQGMTQPQGPPSAQQPPPRPPPPIEQRPPSARPPSIASGLPPPPPPKNDQPGAVPRSTASPVPTRTGRYDAPPPLPGQSAPPPRPQSIYSPPPPLPNQYQSQYQPPRQDVYRQSYPNQQRPAAPPAQHPQRQSIVGPPMPMPNQQPQVANQNYQPSQQQQPYPPNMVPPPQQGPPQHGPPQQGQYVQQAQQAPYQAQHQQVQPPPPQPQPMAPPPQQQQQQQPSYMPPRQPAPQPPKPKTPQPNLMDDSPFDIALPTTNANLPTPAIPPNPEKQHILQTLSSTLLITLQNQITQSSAALGPLQSQYTALQAAEQTLQSELAQLKTLQGQLSQNVGSLDSTIKAADRTISSSQSSSSADKIPSVDEMIIPPTVVARQLYDAVAEQRGYEAAIYALTEGFVRGRIGSDLWARKMRECAREDFRRKYLIKKRLGEGMGLDMSQM